MMIFFLDLGTMSKKNESLLPAFISSSFFLFLEDALNILSSFLSDCACVSHRVHWGRRPHIWNGCKTERCFPTSYPRPFFKWGTTNWDRPLVMCAGSSTLMGQTTGLGKLMRLTTYECVALVMCHHSSDVMTRPTWRREGTLLVACRRGVFTVFAGADKGVLSPHAV